jgi:hypothetical protein
MVILDIPDSGAFYVYDGDNIDTEMIRAFIGTIPCLHRSSDVAPVFCMRGKKGAGLTCAVMLWQRTMTTRSWSARS